MNFIQKLVCKLFNIDNYINENYFSKEFCMHHYVVRNCFNVQVFGTDIDGNTRKSEPPIEVYTNVLYVCDYCNDSYVKELQGQWCINDFKERNT